MIRKITKRFLGLKRVAGICIQRSGDISGYVIGFLNNINY
jgi:hypothetical protein